MRKTIIAITALFTAIVFLSGCHCDIVCTEHVNLLTRKAVCIEPLTTEDPSVGKVLRDAIEKEFVRRSFEVCDSNNATIFISGSAFLTEQSKSKADFFSDTSVSSVAIESVSLVAKDPKGQILASATYDNTKRYSASRLAKQLGSALANRLK